jgi:hypothetical protein
MNSFRRFFLALFSAGLSLRFGLLIKLRRQSLPTRRVRVSLNLSCKDCVVLVRPRYAMFVVQRLHKLLSAHDIEHERNCRQQRH